MAFCSGQVVIELLDPLVPLWHTCPTCPTKPMSHDPRIRIPNHLTKSLDEWIERQPVPPTRQAVAERALESFLGNPKLQNESNPSDYPMGFHPFQPIELTIEEAEYISTLDPQRYSGKRLIFSTDGLWHGLSNETNELDPNPENATVDRLLRNGLLQHVCIASDAGRSHAGKLLSERDNEERKKADKEYAQQRKKYLNTKPLPKRLTKPQLRVLILLREGWSLGAEERYTEHDDGSETTSYIDGEITSPDHNAREPVSSQTIATLYDQELIEGQWFELSLYGRRAIKGKKLDADTPKNKPRKASSRK